jgi:hypothetical protein
MGKRTYARVRDSKGRVRGASDEPGDMHLEVLRKRRAILQCRHPKAGEWNYVELQALRWAISMLTIEEGP